MNGLALCSKLNGLALCSGYGGFDLGLGLVLGDDYRTVCHVEREAYAAATLVARMADKALDQAPVWDDIKSFDGRPWRGVVDIITAGYPCQPFSLAGKRLGADDPRHLWPHVARICREVQPAWIFLENVAGHLGLGGYEVCRELQGMGYRVAATLWTAEEIGATHRRERLFILAHAPQFGERKPDHETGTESRERARESAGSGGGGMGDASRQRPGEAGRFHGRSPERAGGTGEALADAGGAGFQGAEWGSAPEEREGAQAHGPVAELREISGHELAGSESDETDGNHPVVSHGGIPLFPAGPSDFTGWAAVPDHLKPAVRRVADGAAIRVDRLRALGNGIVPAVAAAAFIELAEALSS